LFCRKSSSHFGFFREDTLLGKSFWIFYRLQTWTCAQSNDPVVGNSSRNLSEPTGMFVSVCCCALHLVFFLSFSSSLLKLSSLRHKLEHILDIFKGWHYAIGRGAPPPNFDKELGTLSKWGSIANRLTGIRFAWPPIQKQGTEWMTFYRVVSDILSKLVARSFAQTSQGRQ
jgi:hypothetical protein